MSTGPKAKVDTLHDMVSLPDPQSGRGDSPPPEPPPASASPRRRRWRLVGVVAATLAVLLIVQVVVASQLQTPWIAFEPGAATSTDGLLEVHGADTYDDDGEILYLTVRQNRLTALEWLVNARDPYIDIERESDIYPEQSPSEVREVNADLMVRSKTDAELVALDYLGYDVYEATGAVVLGIEPDSPASLHLAVNEVITAVAGRAIPDAPTLVSVLKAFNAGDVVTLDLERMDGTEPHAVDVTLGARPDGAEGGFLGITSDTRTEEAPNVPVTVDIDSGDVGGNSAGLAFALSIIDALTEGSLTGDHKVAVTGTIQLDGSVGNVGGVEQKAVAARRSGATHMLVPKDLEKEALKHAGDMIVIPVATLQEALDALASLGGNADALALPAEAGAN